MKPSKFYEALHALIGERVPLHIWGACSVGKSQIVSQVANDLDYDFLDVRAVQLDPVDLRGLPRIAADQTEWVSAEEQARVAREIDANVRASLMRGTEDLWKRLREVVAHMVDRLNEPESRFHGSLVTNVLDLVEILPRLNVNGDADLSRFAEQVQQRLCNYSAQDLKKHDLLRVTTVADAANIVAEMDGLLRDREAMVEPGETPSADDIFTRMSAYMEAPAAA
jgi:hypothetical protein